MLAKIQQNLALHYTAEHDITQSKRHARRDASQNVLLHEVKAHADIAGKHSFLSNPCDATVDVLNDAVVNAGCSGYRCSLGAPALSRWHLVKALKLRSAIISSLSIRNMLSRLSRRRLSASTVPRASYSCV